MTDSYALTPTQAGMLYHALQAGPGSGVDIQQISLFLPEALEASTWIQAFEQVTARHATLRTRLRWEGVDEPCQDVFEAVVLPAHCVDWRDFEPETQRDLLLEQAASERERGFDLSQAPLMRLFLAQLADDSWMVIWTFHHLILDGRAFAGVLREVFEAYDALRLGEPADDVPGRPFEDYVRQLQGMDMLAAEAFWRRVLHGFRHPTTVPLPRPDPQTLAERRDGPRYGARQARLPSELSRALRLRAALLNVGVGTLVHTAWAILLQRYAAVDEVVFGTTRSCAHLLPVDGSDARGVFINTVPLRVSVPAEATVPAAVAGVRAAQLEMRPFEWAPLSRIQTWSESDRSRPLFDSLVVYDHESLGQRMRQLGGAWNRRHVDYVGQTSYPLTLVAYGDDEILLRLEFDRERFADPAMQRMLGHVRMLLGGLADEQLGHVHELPWLSVDEQAALTAPSTLAPPFPRGPLLHRWFEDQVRRTPHAPALTGSDAQGRRVELSYAQLNERANRLAHQLRARGVRPNHLVGLRTERNVELVIGLLAILKAGGAYLPLDPVYPIERAAFMVQDAGVQLVLTQASLRPGLSALPVQTVCIDDASAADFSDAQDPETLNAPDDLAYVIYTSGSTGVPKGVRISHHNVCRLFASTHRWFGFDGRDVWTLFHSYAFDFSVWELWGALLYGGRLVVVDQALSRDVEAFRDLLVRERVTVLNQTPTAFRRLVELCSQGEAVPLSLRYVVFGGEALELQMLRPWFDRFGDLRPSLVNMYGITETTVHVTYRPITRADVDAGLGSVIGVPIPDLRVLLLDARLQPVPIGVPGELVVAGAGVSAGYLNRAELTDQRFVPDPFADDPAARLYRSGDLARWLESGELEYLGRIDQQVKIRGFRIELGEIESRLVRHPAVRQCAVVAREDTPGDKRLVAYLVLSADAPAVIDECRQQLRDALPDYMVPAHFVCLDVLPLTANGKLDQRALPPPQEARLSTPSQTAARTPLEAALVEIWQSVLRLDAVGIHDHFMDLGGDSILSIQVLARCRQRGLPFTLKELYERPTIAELAAGVSVAAMAPLPHAVAPVAHPAEAAVQAPAETPAAEPVGVDALTPIQHWFFEQAFEAAHHWNQSFLFELDGAVATDTLAAAWAALVRAHAALRTGFRTGPDGRWHARPGTAAFAPLEVVDLSDVPEAELSRAIEERCADIQAGLDVEHGPLARALHLRCGTDRAARLLIAVHHLAVDGVSWRLLVEDFEAAVLAIRNGDALPVVAPSTSVGDWALALAAFTRNSPAIAASLPYWRAVAQARGWSLPVVVPATGAGTAAQSCVRLSVEQTRMLLTRLPVRQASAPIAAALLSALMRALRVWTAASPLRIDLEGHGRDPIDAPIDLARTVGWFTSLYPVALELAPQADARVAFDAVEQQLQQVPDKGRSYGLLRYLADDPQLARTLSAVAPAPVLFNYLGQFDAVVAGSSLLRFAHESTGPWRSPRARRTHALEVIAWVREGCLEVQWHHDAEALLPEAVERVAQAMRRSLLELLQGLDSPAVSPAPRMARSLADEAPSTGLPGPGALPVDGLGRSPAGPAPVQPATDGDHDRFALDLNLDELLSPLTSPTARPESLPVSMPAGPFAGTPMPDDRPYGLTAMQRLFFAMDAVRPALGLEQWHFTLSGPLDVARLQAAWQTVIARHDVLHSVFESGADGQPAQRVVPPSAPIWTVHDLRDRSDEDGRAELQRFLQADAARRLPLDQAPLMRMALLRTGDQTWQFVWTTHHLVIDGWSWPIVMREVAQAYEAALDGRTPPWRPALPYRRYVDWVAQAAVDAPAFWRAQLQDVDRPTPVGRSPLPEGTFAIDDQPGETVVTLPADLSGQLIALARRWRATPGSLFNAAWALVLAHGAAQSAVVFGAAFSGRPPELDGVEGLVGPCVHDVPLRIGVDPAQAGEEWVRALHRLQIDVAQHLYLPLEDIQQQSGVPWRHRLFDSLVVFQNYQGGDETRHLGRELACELRLAPESTNFPLTITVATGQPWRLRFLHDRRVHAATEVERLAAETVQALRALCESPSASVGDWLAALPAESRGTARSAEPVPPLPVSVAVRPAVGAGPASPGGRAVEAELLALWRELFATDAVGLDDNFFDLGGHSLLLVRTHRLVEQRLQRPVPLMALLRYPSVRALARHLAGDEPPVDTVARLALDRAGKHRQALARQRPPLGRRTPE